MNTYIYIAPGGWERTETVYLSTDSHPPKYEGRSKSFATQYDAQMTQAIFLCYYST